VDVRSLAWLTDQLFCSHQSPYVVPLIPVAPYYGLPVSPGIDGRQRPKVILTHGALFIWHLASGFTKRTGSAVLTAVPVCHKLGCMQFSSGYGSQY
jgi:hypothetical protein